jgi:hypothetical protein
MADVSTAIPVPSEEEIKRIEAKRAKWREQYRQRRSDPEKLERWRALDRARWHKLHQANPDKVREATRLRVRNHYARKRALLLQKSITAPELETAGSSEVASLK